MLKNIPATLSPDLLWCLASMGHAERLVLVDRNFPAHDVARHTSTGKLIEQGEEGVEDSHDLHGMNILSF